ncbi:MAG TPA: CHAT domain-containing protein [Thermoanaerobaculia bacterium]|nr:CHAT domain-containing protein [Thermoanaerobaculia bacterium]
MAKLRIALLLCMMAMAIAASAATPAETLVQAFVDALRRDDPRLLGALIHPAAPPPDVFNLRDFIDANDCTWIDDFRFNVLSATDDTVVIQVEVHGGAAMKASWRPKAALPRFWRLEARRDGEPWKLTRAETDERTVALAMLAAPGVSDADAILAAARPELDRGRIVMEYAGAGAKARLDHLRALIPTIDVRAQVYVRRQIAGVFRGTPQSLEEASQAVALAEARGTPDDRATALLTLGTLTYSMHDFRTAIEVYSRAAELTEVCDDPIPSMKALYMRGFMSTLLYDNANVLLDADRFSELASRFGWLEGQEVIALRRGQTLGLLGNLELARAAYEEGIRIGARNGNPQHLGIFLHSIAEIDSLLGDQNAALEGFRRALTVQHQLPSWLMFMRFSLASTYLQVGDLVHAEEVLQEAEAAFSDVADPQMKNAQAKILEVKAELLLAQGKSQAALDAAAAAVRALGDEYDKSVMYKAHSLAGRALRRLGRPAESAAELRAAIETLDSWLRHGQGVVLPPNLQAPLDAHVELIELLVDEGQNAEALFVAEQMKARSLREALAHGRIDLSASMTAEEQAKEKELEERIVEQNKEMLRALGSGAPLDAVRERIAAARVERDAFVSEMRTRYRDIARRRIAPDHSIALPPTEEPLALVEYVVGENRTTVFVVVDGTVHAARIAVPRREVERAANEVALLIGSRSAHWRNAAGALYRRLFAPVERWTRGAKILCIVPDRALWSVPFHALVDANGAPLIDRHAVFYAHSLTLLKTAWSAQAAAPSRLIAFGNPNVEGAAANVRTLFRDVTIGPLPDAETEVRSLASLYPQSSRIYVREAAREGVFKSDASQYEIVHLAAHALVDPRAPMYSAIVLAGGRDRAEDGLLEAREIADAPLHARLVVLSACDTARGWMGSGEGVLGLAWAFFAAGAPTTVASQWKAESRSTARLMVAFHEHLTAGETTAAALRHAQLALRRSPRYAHPFYWAAFVAVGAAGRDLSR